MEASVSRTAPDAVDARRGRGGDRGKQDASRRDLQRAADAETAHDPCGHEELEDELRQVQIEPVELAEEGRELVARIARLSRSPGTGIRPAYPPGTSRP